MYNGFRNADPDCATQFPGWVSSCQMRSRARDKRCASSIKRNPAAVRRTCLLDRSKASCQASSQDRKHGLKSLIATDCILRRSPETTSLDDILQNLDILELKHVTLPLCGNLRSHYPSSDQPARSIDRNIDQTKPNERRSVVNPLRASHHFTR